MSMQRRRTPRELLDLVGKVPALAAAAAVGLWFPSVVLAQAGDAPGVRDPMRPSRDGGQNQVVVSEHNTVTLQLKDEDLANVLQMLSTQTQKNIIASKNVSARVSAALYDVTFYEALDAILHVNGFGYLEQGNFIYVYTNDELKQIEAALKKRVAKVVRLNYLNATDAKTFAEPLLSRDGGQIQTSEKTANFSIPEKSPTGKDDFALTATLVVIDYEENIKAIEELLTQLDTRPAQVLIEATILQTSLNEANAFGIDFSIIGDLKFTDFINIGGPLAAANSLIRGGTGAANQGLSPANNQGTAITSTPGNTSGPGTFKVGVVGGDLSIFLRMLDTITDTVILSNPKILTLNRQPARVLVGKRVGYLSTTSTETSTTQTVQFLDTGTQLYFRPFVSVDGNIRMELKPQVSAAEIRTITDANGAAVTIPDEVTQELVTNVNVRDGQTVVLGGLFTDSQTFNRRQVPFLGDIPLIGAAFRGNDDNTQRSEIIFLITPTIITDQSVAAAAEKANADIDRVRAGARQGLLPWSREKMTAQLNVEAERLAREGKHDKALWTIQRSLSLNPHQPAVYRLRERITGEREHWPDESRLNNIFRDDTDRRLEPIQTLPEPPRHRVPWGSQDQGRDPVDRPGELGANFFVPAVPETGAVASADPIAAAMMDFNSRELQTRIGGGFAEQAIEMNGERVQMVEAVRGTQVSRPASAQAQTPAQPTTVSFNPQTDPKLVQSELSNLRLSVATFVEDNDGSMPALGIGANAGWQSLFHAGLLSKVPSNVYVGGPNAGKVVMGFKPDTKFHTEYGWIFNPETGELWAAGFDAKDRPLANVPVQSVPTQPVATTTPEAVPMDRPSASVTVEDVPNR
ncbi:MAG: hypothetical protein KF768_08825 [Phycisphaeraceae bacterium]|nr:hypothetical protein [Phycisphaeraceae bacterium]